MKITKVEPSAPEVTLEMSRSEYLGLLAASRLASTLGALSKASALFFASDDDDDDESNDEFERLLDAASLFDGD